MSSVFRTVKTNGAGGCGCAECRAAGPTTAKHTEAPDPPSLDDAIRAAAELPNAHGNALRVVEFFEGEVERDLPIVGWNTDDGTPRPIVVGGLPDHGRLALFYNSGGGDYAAETTGRYSTLDGKFSAPDVVTMRLHFKTDFESSAPKSKIVASPTAAKGVADPPADLDDLLRADRGGLLPIVIGPYDKSKPVPDAPQLQPEHFRKQGERS